MIHLDTLPKPRCPNPASARSASAGTGRNSKNGLSNTTRAIDSLTRLHLDFLMYTVTASVPKRHHTSKRWIEFSKWSDRGIGLGVGNVPQGSRLPGVGEGLELMIEQ